MPPCGASLLMARGGCGAGITRHCRIPICVARHKENVTDCSRTTERRDSCSSGARSAKAAAGNDERAFVRVLSHIFMDTQLLIIAFLRIRTLDKLFEATIALVNFRICN